MDNRFQIILMLIEDGELLREAISKTGISKRGLTAIKYRRWKDFCKWR